MRELKEPGLGAILNRVVRFSFTEKMTFKHQLTSVRESAISICGGKSIPGRNTKEDVGGVIYSLLGGFKYVGFLLWEMGSVGEF